MKSILFTIITLVSLNVFATVDAQSEVYIVVANYHEENSYMVQKAPASFCLGEMPAALTAAIVQPVTIKSNYGCGHTGNMIVEEQINAATCAVISSSNTVYPDTNNTNWAIQTKTDITVDLSKCGNKASDKAFVRALAEATYKTFNASGIQINKYNQK